MRVKKLNGKAYGVEFSATERKAMQLEINRQILEKDERYKEDVDAMILYVLLGLLVLEWVLISQPIVEVGSAWLAMDGKEKDSVNFGKLLLPNTTHSEISMLWKNREIASG